MNSSNIAGNAKKVKDQSQTEENKNKYRELDKKVKNSAEQDWKNWIDIQASALEGAASRKSQREVYQKVQTLTGKKYPKYISGKRGCQWLKTKMVK